MQTTPYHMQALFLADEGIWHDNTTCPIGQYIPSGYLQAGVGSGRRHCPYCVLLNEPLAACCTPASGVTIYKVQHRDHAAAHRLPLT
jgi:hypothetical protein